MSGKIKILIGDCREMLRSLPDESVHCVVTSPPYWGLRDYGVAGQLGLEKTLGEHIAVMVDVFREVRRVLRKDGTLWLNYGDSYATSMNGRSAADTKEFGSDDRTFRDKPFSTIGPIYDPDGGQVPDNKNPKARTGQTDNKGNKGSDHGGPIRAGGYLKPKDLCGVPWRVAFALQEDGWWLRQDIIWSKPNPMPESVRDRCTKAHEYIFMLTKSKNYYYDQEAISEDAIYSGLVGQDASGFKNAANFGGKYSGENSAGGERPDKQRGHERRHAGFNDRWDAMEKSEQCGGKRPKRSVWEIATAPFSEAHFATFPPALIEPCIKAGSSEHGCCSSCGSPWSRQIQRKSIALRPNSNSIRGDSESSNATIGSPQRGSMASSRKTTGWAPTCNCADASIMPCTILDPFGGAGTVGVVANRRHRSAILVELNPEYAAMAGRRIYSDDALFSSVSIESPKPDTTEKPSQSSLFSQAAE